jgi:hypothetical protein
MLQVVKRLSTADYMTAAIFLNYNQLNHVQDAVKSVSYCETEVLFWMKTGQFEHPHGPRLSSVVEVILLVYMRAACSEGASNGRSMLHYNYEANEARGNCLQFPAVRVFARNTAGHKVNAAQKPIDLLRFIVKHWSRTGDWVMDICSGTGIRQDNIFTINQFTLLVNQVQRRTRVLWKVVTA